MVAAIANCDMSCIQSLLHAAALVVPSLYASAIV